MHCSVSSANSGKLHSKLINGTVVNWSYPNNSVRCNVPVGVARETDPDRVKDLLIEVAQEHPGVSNEPSPDVLFDSAGSAGLNFASVCGLSLMRTSRICFGANSTS